MTTHHHPATRRKSGRPARQRHAHATQAKHEATNARKGTKKRWSKHVAETSDALDIEGGIFKSDRPEAIAQSLKASALRSKRRKGTPYQSAMSMLNFYINRAGRNLPKTRRETLQKAKKKLREVFGREE